MSSDLHQPIGSFDIRIIRKALRHAGFAMKNHSASWTAARRAMR